MVISLGEPTINDVDVTNRVIAERQGGRNRQYFNAIAQDWIERIQLYLTVFGNPEVIGNSIISVKDSGKFVNLYIKPKDDSSQKNEVLNILRSHGLDFCPACGEDGFPRTLDHYLPKERFPEFSLLSRNLSPMCDMCQGAKLAKVLTANAEKLFLHPYYDNLRDTPVLTAQILPPYNSGTTTRIGIRDDVHPISLRQLCIRHCEEMEIPARYQVFFRTQYLRLRRLLIDRRNGDNLPIAELTDIIEIFRRLFILKSCNSWNYVFYTSVLENPDLLHFLASGDIRIAS